MMVYVRRPSSKKGRAMCKKRKGPISVNVTKAPGPKAQGGARLNTSTKIYKLGWYKV